MLKRISVYELWSLPVTSSGLSWHLDTASELGPCLSFNMFSDHEGKNVKGQARPGVKLK